MDPPQRKLAKLCLVPQRAILVVMSCLGLLHIYSMRICINLALTEIAPSMYTWSFKEQSHILSSFYYGYILAHLPGGILSDRFGGKHVLGIAVLTTAVLTMITPLIIHATKGNVTAVIVIRVAMGFSQGPTYPALNAILGQWIPAKERAFCGSVVYTGSHLGSIMGLMSSGILISFYGNWSIVFYVYGAAGCLWWIFWSFMCFSSPDYSPFLGEKERVYLHQELDRHVNRKHERKKIPWRTILTSTPVWFMLTAQIGHDWIWFIIVTDLPRFFEQILGTNNKENRLYLTLSYTIMWFNAVFTGWLCDFLIAQGTLEITQARRILTTIGAIGPTAFLLLAAYSNGTAVLVLVTIALYLMGPYYSGVMVNALDLAPNFSGTLMALANGFGAIAGLVAPSAVDAVVSNYFQEEWQFLFYITLGISLVSSVAYVLYASAEEQEWNDLERSRVTE